MALNVKPIAGTKNRVLIEPAAAEEKTASGIFIPDTAKEKPQKGKVISLSEVDEDGKKPVLNVGDEVLYGKYAGTEVELESIKYLIMKESDILLKVVKK
jgi:chaperonin GroES